MHFGIDFGSRYKGTTAVCLEVNGKLHCRSSAVGGDADALIMDMAGEKRPGRIFIDAPLSLPSAYFHKDAANYMYRSADRELSAMSPMFLGGLTARAMRLKDELSALGIGCLETYPKAALRLHFDTLPDRKSGPDELARWTGSITGLLPVPLAAPPADWHQFDAIVCWLSGFRFRKGVHRSVGDPDEGVIIL